MSDHQWISLISGDLEMPLMKIITSWEIIGISTNVSMFMEKLLKVVLISLKPK